MFESLSVLLMYSLGGFALLGVGWYVHRMQVQQAVAVKDAEIRRLRLELSEYNDTSILASWHDEVARIQKRLPRG